MRGFADRHWTYSSQFLALVRLFANSNFETANHERFSRSPVTHMPPITIVTLVSHHRFEMPTFFASTLADLRAEAPVYLTLPSQWPEK